MRDRGVRVYTPVEEGAAEMFANQVFSRMTGVPGELRSIETCKPWQDGLRLLGRRVYGEGNAMAWARQSRSTPNQAGWFFGELQKLQFNLVSIFRITEYNSEAKAHEWFAAVKAGLKGGS